MFATSLATDAFNPVAVLADDSSTVGGIAPGSNAWWKNSVLDQSDFADASGEHTTQSPQVVDYIAENDMQDHKRYIHFTYFSSWYCKCKSSNR